MKVSLVLLLLLMLHSPGYQGSRLSKRLRQGAGNQTALAQPSEDSVNSFKDFNFITKSEMQYLLDVLNQPLFFSHLPENVRKIVKEENRHKYNLDSEKLDMEVSRGNVSELFVDTDGKMGVKGLVQVVDPSASLAYAYGIANSRLFVVYRNANSNEILAQYRKADMVVKDVKSSPCIVVCAKVPADGSLLICLQDIDSKEIWLRNLL